MTSPDFEGAKAYALQRLQELPAILTYHSIAHTRDHVVPAAEQLALLEGFAGEDVMLLSTAAWFHDLGYLEQHEENEVIAVRMAQEVLPPLGYSSAQTETIGNIIMATRLPQTPRTPLETCIADADFMVFGSTRFLESVEALRQEFSVMGRIYDDTGWYSFQLEFLQQHHYFTTSAHRLYDDQKRANIATIEKLLTRARGQIQLKP